MDNRKRQEHIIQLLKEPGDTVTKTKTKATTPKRELQPIAGRISHHFVIDIIWPTNLSTEDVERFIDEIRGYGAAYLTKHELVAHDLDEAADIIREMEVDFDW